MAVGYSGTGALVESWNGTTWSVLLSPSLGSAAATLNGISCTSTKFCASVGGMSNSSSAGSVVRPLVEFWDGTSWSVVTSPNLARPATLNGISCTSSKFCASVGGMSNSSSAGSVVRPLVEFWDGTSWSVVTSPNLARPATLNGVSCPSVKFCAAVGNDGSATLVEFWNGVAWSLVPSLTPGTYGGFSGVSCGSASSCTAVGNYSYGTGSGSSILPQALAESWNGQAWSVARLPSPSVAHLYGVSCTAGCQAVGDYLDARGIDRSLVESWNGALWSWVTVPSLPTADLYGVACAAVKLCKAVGEYSTNISGLSPMDALIESWNGTVWSLRG